MCEYNLGFKAANKLPMTECEQYEELLEQFLEGLDLIITKACESRESTIRTDVLDMAKVTTLPAILQPLMGKPSIKAHRCVVCGCTYPLNNHHIVRRSAGKMYVNGIELEKPVITLCGSGNASGCHGLAHENRLHFRWVTVPQKAVEKGLPTINGGHWEYKIFDEPIKYIDAIKSDRGWKRIST